MKRPIFILVSVAVLAVALFSGAHALTERFWARHCAESTDDLEWLRQEFRLSDAELTRIRRLHDSYLPQCQEYCSRIAAKRRELQATVGATTNLPAVAEQTLAEIAALRAQCQAAMLRHFAQVSQVMPPEQGRRYLVEMQRLTLGSHERVEQTMSGAPPADHGHH